jgi:hypothetical protein
VETVFLPGVIASILLLCFPSTRALGAVGVFVLLCVAPVLSGLLLILAAIGGYYIAGKPKFNGISKKLPWRD